MLLRAEKDELLRLKASEIITFVDTPEEAVSYCEKNRNPERKSEILKRKKKERYLEMGRNATVGSGVLVVGIVIGYLIGGRRKR